MTSTLNDILSLTEADEQEGLYSYKGPARRFETSVGEFDIHTDAKSKSQAISRIKYKIAKKLGFTSPAGIWIDENLIKFSPAHTQPQKDMRKEDGGEYEQISFFDKDYLGESITHLGKKISGIRVANKSDAFTYAEIILGYILGKDKVNIEYADKISGDKISGGTDMYKWDDDYYNYILDLNDRLELNMHRPDYGTINIWYDRAEI